MDTEEEIAAEFRRRYLVSGIVLHGSRAWGQARAHSDWDILLTYEQGEASPPLTGRTRFADETVEWKAVELPFSGAKLVAELGPALQRAKILWEAGSGTSQLLEQVHAIYAAGLRISEDEILRRCLFLLRRLHGLTEDVGSPHILQRHLCIFHTSAMNWWFEILNHTYSLPYYEATKVISKLDPPYAADLDILVSGTGTDLIAAAAIRLYLRLFPDYPTEPT